MKKRTTKRTKDVDFKVYISSRGEIVVGKYNLDLDAATELYAWLGKAIGYITRNPTNV